MSDWEKPNQDGEDANQASDVKPTLFSRLTKGLSKTRSQLATGVGNLLLGEREIDEAVLEDLETALLLTDVGVDTTTVVMAEFGQGGQAPSLE